MQKTGNFTCFSYFYGISQFYREASFFYGAFKTPPKNRMLFFCRVFTVKINLIVKTQVCKSCFDNLRGLCDPTSKKTEGDLHGRVFRGFFRGTIFYGVFFLIFRELSVYP